MSRSEANFQETLKKLEAAYEKLESATLPPERKTNEKFEMVLATELKVKEDLQIAVSKLTRKVTK